MQIIREETYLSNLEAILDFIAQDSIKKAYNFLSQLDSKINEIPNFPYKYRQSLYYKHENTRDLVFKGYTLIYHINTSLNQIIIFDIFKWINKPQ